MLGDFRRFQTSCKFTAGRHREDALGVLETRSDTKAKAAPTVVAGRYSPLPPESYGWGWTGVLASARRCLTAKCWPPMQEAGTHFHLAAAFSTASILGSLAPHRHLEPTVHFLHSKWEVLWKELCLWL